MAIQEAIPLKAKWFDGLEWRLVTTELYGLSLTSGFLSHLFSFQLFFWIDGHQI
jgi:hypothetical protein